MKVSVNEVWKMDCKTYFKRVEILDVILAEERYILQRQLDNHVKLNYADSIKDFSSIYKEFGDQMGVITETRQHKEYTEEELEKIWKEKLDKVGF
jgi:hypothetical protein